MSSLKKLLSNHQEIFDYFQDDKHRILYLSQTPMTLAGAQDWIGGFHWVSSFDAFGGNHDRNFVPSGYFADFNSVEEYLNDLLRNESVQDFVKQQSGEPLGLFLMFNEESEMLAQKLGLKICLPPAKMRTRLDGKIESTRLAEKAGVRAVPHALGRVDSYSGLLQLARGLGSQLVVQLPYGDCGSTTFFINSERDFDHVAEHIIKESEVKVMKRIRCLSLTIEGCVTRHGILLGPLMKELIGIPELTGARGGWCGNELFGTDSGEWSVELLQHAQKATEAIGNQMAREGYRGIFGVDFLHDLDSGLLYFGELNPRLTGITPLTCQAALDAHHPPLILFHLLEWLEGVDYRVDRHQMNQLWLDNTTSHQWSLMIIKHCESTEYIAKHLSTRFMGGIWHMDDRGDIHFSRPAANPDSIVGEQEGYLFRTIDDGQRISKGVGLARLFLRGRVTHPDGTLNLRALSWVTKIRSMFIL